MIGFWQTLIGPICCRDSSIQRTLTDLTARVDTTARTRQTGPAATTPAPQVAEELQRLEDRLATSVQQLPEGAQQTFRSLKQALDNIQSALTEGRAINPQDLQTFQQQAQRLGQLLGTTSPQVQATATTADVSGAVSTFTNQMTTSWADWRIGPGNVENAYDALNDLPADQRNQALTTLFRDNPDKVRAFMENLVEDKPDLIPNVMKWFDEAGLSADVKNTYTSTYQADLRSKVVNVFTNNMTTSLLTDWQVGPGNVESAYNILNDLSPAERGVALNTLFQNNPDKVRAFMQNVPEDQSTLAMNIHNWFSDSNVPSQVRNVYNRDYRANLVSGSDEVSTFTSQMSYAAYDWRIGAGNVQNAYDALKDLSSADRSTALTSLFRDHPDQARRFFANLVEDNPALIKDVMQWFSDPNLSAEAKNAFIRGVKGEAFTSFQNALNHLDEADRQAATAGIMRNFGPDCWAAKLTLEGIRAQLNGDTEGANSLGTALRSLSVIATAASALTGPLPPGFTATLNVYGQAIEASAQWYSNRVLETLDSGSTSLRPESYLLEAHGLSVADDGNRRNSVTNVMTALNRWASR